MSKDDDTQSSMRSNPQRDLIAVGIDGSPEAMAAARYAAHEAQLRRCDLLLVHAYPIPAMYGPFAETDIEYLREGGQDLLDQVIADLDTPPEVQLRTLLEAGAPIPLLTKVAATARLVVVGRRHAHWGERLLTGSVSSAISSKSPCAVICVPEGWEPDLLTTRPVVVALDGETAAHAPLRFAFEAAEAAQCELLAIHADPFESTKAQLAAQQVNIAAVLAGWREEFPNVTVHTHAVMADANDAVVAASVSAGLLVVGRPHAAGNAPLWIWSVARAALKQTRCPLAVVPQDLADRREVPTHTVASDLLIPTY